MRRAIIWLLCSACSAAAAQTPPSAGACAPYTKLQDPAVHACYSEAAQAQGLGASPVACLSSAEHLANRMDREFPELARQLGMPDWGALSSPGFAFTMNGCLAARELARAERSANVGRQAQFGRLIYLIGIFDPAARCGAQRACYTFSARRGGELNALLSWPTRANLDLELWQNRRRLCRAARDSGRREECAHLRILSGRYEVRVVLRAGTPPPHFELFILQPG